MLADLCKIIFTFPKNNFNFNFNFFKRKGAVLHNPFIIMVENPKHRPKRVFNPFY